jgi:hypothetical protein
MYASQCRGEFTSSVLSLIQACNAIGVRTAFFSICNESLVQRARNYIADEFLRSNFTHLLFVDTDIIFTPDQVIHLLRTGKELIGAQYPKKTIPWNEMRTFVQAGETDHLDRIAGGLVYNGPCEDIVETDILMTGFMLVERSVFLKLTLAYPEYYYRPDHERLENFCSKRQIQLFFSSEIDPETQRLVSEYEFFCKMWRKIGGKIYTCPKIVIQHIGPILF